MQRCSCRKGSKIVRCTVNPYYWEDKQRLIYERDSLRKHLLPLSGQPELLVREGGSPTPGRGVRFTIIAVLCTVRENVVI